MEKSEVLKIKKNSNFPTTKNENPNSEFPAKNPNFSLKLKIRNFPARTTADGPTEHAARPGVLRRRQWPVLHPRAKC